MPRPPKRGCLLLAAAAAGAAKAPPPLPTPPPVPPLPTPPPAPYARPGARLLVVELPLAADTKAVSQLAIPPGLTLDASRPGRVVVGDYPTAEITWAGAPGASAPASVPHRELRVQLPVSQKGSAGWWHDVYAVMDDDVAVLLARDGAGVPAKLGRVAFPAAAAGDVTIRASRRGADVVSFSGARGAAVAPADLGPAPLGRTLNLFGTQAMLGTGIIPTSNSIYLATNTSVAVTAAWAFDAGAVSFAGTAHEPLAALFGASAAPSAAWWMEADVGAAGAPPPAFAGAAGGGPMGTIAGLEYFMHNYMLRYGGAPQRPSREPFDGNSGFEWQDGRFVWATLQLDTAAVTPQLPPGATLADDKARLFCAWYPTAHLNKEIGSMGAASTTDDNFPYHEFAIRLYIKLNNKVWRHVVYILVDDEPPLTSGRDMLGTPKKLANFTFPDEPGAFAGGANVSFSIRRRGVPVVDFSGTVGANRTDPAPGLTDDVADVSVFSTQFPTHFGAGGAGQPVYAKWGGSFNVYESRRIDSPVVQWTGSAAEPIKAWFADVPPLDAGYLRQDYGKAADLRTRPSEGKMPADAAAAYWRDTYQVKYGGAPL